MTEKLLTGTLSLNTTNQLKRVPQMVLKGSCTTTVNEPVHSKAYKLASMPGENADQPAYSQSLISLYKYLLDTLWIAKDQEDFDQNVGMRRQSSAGT